MNNWITAGLKAIITPIANVFVTDKELKQVQTKSRVDIAKAKAGRAVAKINADTKKYELQTGIDTKKVEVSASVDAQLIQMRRNSYLDEVVIIVLLAPAVLVFVPEFQGYIENGFIILESLPDFYQALLVLVVVMALASAGG